MTTTDLVSAAESIQAPLDPQELADAGSWAVSSIRDMEFAFECAGESEGYLANLKEQRDDAIARINARFEALSAPHEKRIVYFKGRIAEFAESNRGSLLIGKSKTRALLGGSVSWRKKGGGLVVTDKDALAAWLSTQDPSLFRVSISPDMRALQEHFSANGVIPPGTEFEPDREELTVKTSPMPTLSPAPDRRLPNG